MNKSNFRKGQLLLEVLFAIAIMAIIIGIGSTVIFVGLRGSQIASDRTIALGLVEESFEAVRSFAFEKWTSFYSLTKASTANYYIKKDTTSPTVSYKWITQTPSAANCSAASFNGVSAFSLKAVYIVGANGNFCKWDGEAWRVITIPSSWGTTSLNDISTVSSTELWVVGNGGRVGKYDGSDWIDHSGGALTWAGNNINSVSAPTSSNVWIAGDNGQVWMFDGIAWTQHSGTNRWGTTKINAISGIGSNAWVVGDSGTVWRYNGTSWINGATYTGATWGVINIKGVSFYSTSEVWISGASGHVWKFNGTSWTQHLGTNKWVDLSINEVTAFSPSNVFIVGDTGTVWRYNGTSWTQHSGGWSSTNLLDISDRYSTEVWAVGSSNNVWEFNSARWELVLIASGTDDDVLVGNITFDRSLYIQNVCRDSNGNITGITDSEGVTTTCSGVNSEDPSTQKVTVTVGWTGGQTISASEYITRWKNVVCYQTSWNSNNSGSSVKTCPTTTYDSSSNMLTGPSLSVLDPLSLINPNGELTSAILDTTQLGTSGRGPSYNSILWTGSSDNTDEIRFKIAASDSANGPWNSSDYYGDSNGDGVCSNGASDWYTWRGNNVSNTAKEIKCFSQFNNKRYFRYKIQLCPNTNCSGVGNGPQVDIITISWSP